jgi:hypothetical protein
MDILEELSVYSNSSNEDPNTAPVFTIDIYFSSLGISNISMRKSPLWAAVVVSDLVSKGTCKSGEVDLLSSR